MPGRPLSTLKEPSALSIAWSERRLSPGLNGVFHLLLSDVAVNKERLVSEMISFVSYYKILNVTLTPPYMIFLHVIIISNRAFIILHSLLMPMPDALFKSACVILPDKCCLGQTTMLNH